MHDNMKGITQGEMLCGQSLSLFLITVYNEFTMEFMVSLILHVVLIMLYNSSLPILNMLQISYTKHSLGLTWPPD